MPPISLKRERDDLLTALKSLADACDSAEQSIALEYGTTEEHFKPSAALASARALIARLDGEACRMTTATAVSPVVREKNGQIVWRIDIRAGESFPMTAEQFGKVVKQSIERDQQRRSP